MWHSIQRCVKVSRMTSHQKTCQRNVFISSNRCMWLAKPEFMLKVTLHPKPRQDVVFCHFFNFVIKMIMKIFLSSRETNSIEVCSDRKLTLSMQMMWCLLSAEIMVSRRCFPTVWMTMWTHLEYLLYLRDWNHPSRIPFLEKVSWINWISLSSYILPDCRICVYTRLESCLPIFDVLGLNATFAYYSEVSFHRSGNTRPAYQFRNVAIVGKTYAKSVFERSCHRNIW